MDTGSKRLEVGQEDIRDRILHGVNRHACGVDELEVDAVASLAIGVLAATHGLNQSADLGHFAFNARVRVMIEERVLDLFIAAIIGGLTGTAIPSLGAVGGVLTACAGYMVNCIPEIRKWVRSYLRLQDPRAKLIVDFVRASGPMSESEVRRRVAILGISDVDAAKLLDVLRNDGLLAGTADAVTLNLPEQISSALRQTEHSAQKKTRSNP